MNPNNKGLTSLDMSGDPQSDFSSMLESIDAAATSTFTGMQQLPTSNINDASINAHSLEPQMPPSHILSSTIELFFHHWHGQPYCFFHKQTFQQQLRSGRLPNYLVRAVLGIAIRFSDDPFFADKDRTAAAHASAAWKETFRRIFDSDEVLDHYVVQAATLLALYDFTECKHRTAWIKIGVAVNVAQAMHMMTEPPTELPFSAQEERRRTLWSIYLLDKLATCGRHRPSLFQDQSIRIQLPCSDENFRTSTPQQVVSLEEFLRFVDFRVDHMETLAPTVVVASLLSQVANYTFQRDITGDRKAPWDHTSEYQTICSQLAQFETLFDCYGDIQATILNTPLRQSEPNVPITESTILTYVLYHLCYCLLQHPFLIRRRLERTQFKIPAGFLSRTIVSCFTHAQELTRTLENAARAQYKVSATFLSYASTVAGSIHCLFQHSLDCLTRIQSVEALQSSIMHISGKTRFWKTSGRMIAKLTQFAVDSIRCSDLIDPSLQSVPLEVADIDQLYALCDYGTLSTTKALSSTDTAATNIESEDLIIEREPSPKLDLDGYSGHIDGILPQIFGPTNTGTMIDNFSFALRDHGENEQNISGTNYAWRL